MEISSMTKPRSESFCEKLESLESVEYKAVLAITGAMQGASRDKIYQELGLESLKSRNWCKRLSCMFEEGGRRKLHII